MTNIGTWLKLIETAPPLTRSVGVWEVWEVAGEMWAGLGVGLEVEEGGAAVDKNGRQFEPDHFLRARKVAVRIVEVALRAPDARLIDRADFEAIARSSLTQPSSGEPRG